MKNYSKSHNIKGGLIALFLIFSLQQSYTQLKDVGNMMGGGIDDAELLFREYLTPFANSLGANMAAGWYNTAKPHKLGGFDLTFTINTSFIPDEHKSFNLEDLGLNGTFDNNIAPTFAGERSSGPEISYEYEHEGTTIPLASYNTPQGIGLGVIPTPMLQLGIGLVKETEIIGRYIPRVSLGNTGEIGLWGIGLKHSIKQWIPGISMMPVFNLSIMGGYTKLTTESGLSVTPAVFGTEGSPVIPASDFSNQKMSLAISGFTMNLLASADLPVVTFYGGLGFSRSKTELQLLGDFPIPTFSEEENGVVNEVITDPMSISIEDKSGGVTDPRLNAGIRFKFAVITLHFDYTYANYSIATAGLGVSIR